ncbi:MAG: hypothetical protein KGM98_04960 [Bacteroidota bacterium]|nr:hypothetical protein [Bacteroidota bacterium]
MQKGKIKFRETYPIMLLNTHLQGNTQGRFYKFTGPMFSRENRSIQIYEKVAKKLVRVFMNYEGGTHPTLKNQNNPPTTIENKYAGKP